MYIYLTTNDSNVLGNLCKNKVTHIHTHTHTHISKYTGQYVVCRQWKIRTENIKRLVE